MKSIFYKIALPVFALILAITASIAFTPVSNDVTKVPGYKQILDANDEKTRCDYKKDCQLENSGVICTFGIGQNQLFGQTDPQDVLSCCGVVYECLD